MAVVLDRLCDESGVLRGGAEETQAKSGWQAVNGMRLVRIEPGHYRTEAQKPIVTRDAKTHFERLTFGR